jgi:hypothetical protein
LTHEVKLVKAFPAPLSFPFSFALAAFSSQSFAAASFATTPALEMGICRRASVSAVAFSFAAVADDI